VAALKRIVPALAVVVACASGCDSKPSPPPPATSPAPPVARPPPRPALGMPEATIDAGELSGWILYRSIRDGGMQRLYVEPAAGGEPRRLEDGRAPPYLPAGTPRAYAVRTLEAGHDDVWLWDGREHRRITTSPKNDWGPSLSRDGRRIAFVSERDGNDELYAVGADGTGEVRLTRRQANDRRPVFSPDGGRVAFETHDGVPAIFVMRADGSQVRRLTATDVTAIQPAWSPAGELVAYIRNHDPRELYVVNARTGVERKVAEGRLEAPAFSPDGTRIAVEFERDIWVLSLDGRRARRITRDAMNGAPEWFADPAAAAPAAPDPVADNLVQNGDFEWMVGSDPAGWFRSEAGVSFVAGPREQRGRVLRVEAAGPGARSDARSRGIPLPAGATSVRAEWRWQADDIQGRAEVLIRFWEKVDARGNAAGKLFGEESVRLPRGRTPWKDGRAECAIPAGAGAVDIVFRAFDTAGALLADDVLLVAR